MCVCVCVCVADLVDYGRHSVLLSLLSPLQLLPSPPTPPPAHPSLTLTLAPLLVPLADKRLQRKVQLLENDLNAINKNLHDTNSK